MRFEEGQIKDIGAMNFSIHALGNPGDPPPPPEGSNCDYMCDTCVLLGGGTPDQRLYIMGAESPFGGRCYVQECTTTREHFTRLAFVVNKGSDVIDEPLYVGFCSTDVVNDPQQFFDLNNWEKLWSDQPYTALAINSDLLPTPNTYYWVYVDIDMNRLPGDTIWLAMVTNEPDDLYGWRSGAMTHGYCYGYLNRGQWDGSFEWIVESQNQLMSVIHTEGGNPVFEGNAEIQNPDFPGTADVGVPWVCTFDLYNIAAPCCGCPDTMKWDVIDRENDPEGNNPIIGSSTELLCGYYWGTGGNITFGNAGTFKGRCRAGHDENGSFYVDDTYDFDVVVTEDGTYDCYQCDIPGSPCVLHTGLPNPCDGSTTFTTKTACENATGCSSNGEGVGQITNYYAIPNPLPQGGGDSIAYVTGKNVGDAAGYFVLHIWTAQHGDHYSDSQLLEPGDSMSYNALLTDIIQNTNVHFLIWYWNGIEWEWHDEVWPYVIEVVGAGEDLEILEDESTWYEGPFTPGEVARLADVKLRNNGETGQFRLQCFYHPGDAGGPEAPGGFVEGWIESGQTMTVTLWSTIPPYELPGSLDVGVKAWGDGETEPPWGSMGTKMFKIH